MKKRTALALFPVLLLTTVPVFAHSPIMGIGGVTGGILHALLIPEHGMSLLALGLALGQLEKSERRTGILIFVAALTCALVAAAFAVGEALAADVLLATTGILGLLIVTLWTPAYLVWALAAIVGMTIGLDSRPEVASDASRPMEGRCDLVAYRPPPIHVDLAVNEATSPAKSASKRGPDRE